jgi:hypothetical protein
LTVATSGNLTVTCTGDDWTVANSTITGTVDGTYTATGEWTKP